MAVYNKFNAFVEHVAEKVHNLGADLLKLMAVNSPAPVATNTVKADLTEIAAGNGYSAGGTAITITTSAQSSGSYIIAGQAVALVYVPSGATLSATAGAYGVTGADVTFSLERVVRLPPFFTRIK